MTTITPNINSIDQAKPSDRAQLAKEAESSLSTASTCMKVGAGVASLRYGLQAGKGIVSTLQWLKSLVTIGSTALKVGGAAAAPFTFGTSALAIAGGVALDIAIGETIDAGITICNGGKRLEESRNDWIQAGDWLGQGLYNVFA